MRFFSAGLIFQRQVLMDDDRMTQARTALSLSSGENRGGAGIFTD